MHLLHSFLVGVSLAIGADLPPEPVRLRELLYDRQHPRNQSQAALLLVQAHSCDAEQIVRQGLRQTEVPEVFLALSAALRLCRDSRFHEELIFVLVEGRPLLRQEAAESLALLADDAVLQRLHELAHDYEAETAVRQLAVWALGRCGKKRAAGILLEVLNQDDFLRRAAADALAELSGQNYGLDADRWCGWWNSHKDLAENRWLEERLAYQLSRGRRLEGDLERARAQVVRLQQQLYSRLPAADRLGHLQTLVEYEDQAVRSLAVTWCAELMSTADAAGQRSLAELLLRLSRDGALEVQRPAVLALGRVNDPRAFDHVRQLLVDGTVPVRAAAAHALAQQAMVAVPESLALQREVVPLLQKALSDPALEVVVAAAEGLGSLGIPEAGPVLTALLKHPSDPVRQTAAQALERVADGKVLDGLLEVIEDPAVTVRFSLVGAIGRAAGDGQALTEPQRARLFARLEELVLRDPDPGVRSRGATVLGQCGPPTELPFLYRRLQAQEDARVQDKAWASMLDILTRALNLELLREWDRALADGNQRPRRVVLLTEVCNRWKKLEAAKALVVPATEILVRALLDEGRWALALPAVRDLLSRSGTDAEIDRRLHWLLVVGEQALQEGNKPDALHVVQEAQPFLARRPGLTGEFEKLEKRAH